MATVNTFEGQKKLGYGESGHDEISSGGCSNCWTEPADFGLYYSYNWNKEKEGWDVSWSCGTCGDSGGEFLPFKK